MSIAPTLPASRFSALFAAIFDDHSDSSTFPFQQVSASVTGTYHSDRGQNNQDSLKVYQSDKRLVAVACDGVSGSNGSMNEVGSISASRIIGQAVHEVLDQSNGEFGLDELAKVQKLVLKKLKAFIKLLASSDRSVAGWNYLVKRYCAFTTVCAVVTEKRTVVFACGDGGYALNGEVKGLGPFPGNCPPCIGYQLRRGRPSWSVKKRDCVFSIKLDVPTEDVQSLIVMTDGVLEINKVAGKRIPTRRDPIPTLAETVSDPLIWIDDRGLQDYLSLLQREELRVRKQKSGRRKLVRYGKLLADDSSLVVIRRAK